MPCISGWMTIIPTLACINGNKSVSRSPKWWAFVMACGAWGRCQTTWSSGLAAGHAMLRMDLGLSAPVWTWSKNWSYLSGWLSSLCQAGIELGTLRITGLCTDEVSGTRRKGERHLQWMWSSWSGRSLWINFEVQGFSPGWFPVAWPCSLSKLLSNRASLSFPKYPSWALVVNLGRLGLASLSDDATASSSFMVAWYRYRCTVRHKIWSKTSEKVSEAR